MSYRTQFEQYMELNKDENGNICPQKLVNYLKERNAANKKNANFVVHLPKEMFGAIKGINKGI